MSVKKLSFGFAYSEEVVKGIVFTAVMSQIRRTQRKFVHDINKANKSKQGKAEKRRKPKPLCLSNVHNIIMKLKNGVIKIGRV